MTKAEHIKIILLAKFHVSEWLRLHNPKDEWSNRGQKQAHYDALTGLKYYGFIEDFKLTEKENILVKSGWR